MSIEGISSSISSAAMMQQMKSPSERFQADDTNGDSVLDVTEFSAVAEKISQRSGENIDVEALLAENDTDGDGALNKDEMMNLMESMRPANGGGRPPMGGGPPPAGGAGEASSTSTEEEEWLELLEEQSEEDSLVNKAMTEYLKSASYEGTSSNFQIQA